MATTAAAITTTATMTPTMTPTFESSFSDVSDVESVGGTVVDPSVVVEAAVPVVEGVVVVEALVGAVEEADGAVMVLAVESADVAGGAAVVIGNSPAAPGSSWSTGPGFCGSGVPAGQSSIQASSEPSS